MGGARSEALPGGKTLTAKRPSLEPGLTQGSGHFQALGLNVLLKHASEASRLFQFAFFVIAARRFGAAGLGNLTVLLMVGSGIGLLLGDFGVNTLMIARMSGGTESERNKIASEALFLKSVLCAAAFVLMCGLMSLTKSAASWVDILSVAIISSGGLWLEFLAALTNAVNRFGVEVWLRIGFRGAIYGAGAIAALFMSLTRGLEVMAAITLGTAVVAPALLHGLIPVKMHFGIGGAGLLIESVPVWVTQLAQLTYLKFDVVILGLLHVAAREIGWYAAAWKIADVLTGVPALLSAAALPLISGAAGSKGLRAIAPRYLKAMYVLPFFFALPLTVGAEWITRLLYGQGFAGTTQIMRILVLAVVPFYVHTFLVIVAVAVGRQREAAKLAAVCSIIGISAAVLLVPKLGYQVMAYVSAAANFLFACSIIYRFREVTETAHAGTALKSLSSAAVAFVLSLTAWRNLHPILAIGMAMVSYVGGLMLLGVVGLKDLSRLQRFSRSIFWSRRATEEIGAGV